jgi:hypothetical protein
VKNEWTYTIVFFEKSPQEFSKFPENYIHKFQQVSDTGITMDLLQKYIFVPLDIFQHVMDNKGITSKLDAWLMFLSTDKPERIAELEREIAERTQARTEKDVQLQELT